MIHDEDEDVSGGEHTPEDGDTSMVLARAATGEVSVTLSALLQRAATGDRSAFRGLYTAIGPRVKGFVYSRCRDERRAEEITQEVLLTVWRRADRFDPSRAKAETWIFTIARNRAIDALRRRTLVEADHRDPHFVPEAPLPVDLALQAEQRAQRVREAVSGLPPAQRSVMEQAFFRARSYPEIAEDEGIPLGTVKSRARLAFQRLRALLADEEG